MIPRVALELSSEFPDGHEFWVPRGDEISEEGFGAFRDTWLIRGIGVRDARSVLEAETALVRVADAFSDTFEEYEAIAGALETGELDELPIAVRQSAMFASCERYLPGDGTFALGSLDLGVAGAVYALSTVRCLTAASCRGHGAHSWSPNPVVYVAASRHRAGVLQSMVREADCGFGTDPARDGLLTVEAESVTDMMRLADAILEHRKEFVEHRVPANRAPRTSTDDQLLLDL
jgi:hypothetical protein